MSKSMNATLPVHVFATLGPVLFSEAERRERAGDKEAAAACRKAAELAESLFAAISESAIACYNADKARGGNEFTRAVERDGVTPEHIAASKRNAN